MIKKEHLLILLLISISYLYFQNLFSLDWDFMVYLLNAEFLVGKGHYFEIERPPLISIVLSPFVLFFSKRIAGYFFVLLSFLIYIYSCITFSKKYSLDFKLFLMLMFNPFILYYGLQCGTELLALSMLILAVTYLDKPILLGIFLGLSFLARYTTLPFFILILFSKRKKDIFISASAILFTLSPWLLFNFFFTGHLLYSVLDSYLRNVAFLTWFWHNPLHLLLPFNIFLPFFIFGISKSYKQKDNLFLPMLIILILGIFIYLKAKLDVPRYLFFTTLPIAYFSYYFLSTIKEKLLTLALLFGIGISIIFLFFITSEEACKFAQHFPIDKNCTIVSDRFVCFNFYGYSSLPMFLSYEDKFHETLKRYAKNYTVVLFDYNLSRINCSELNCQFFGKALIVKSERCIKKEKIIVDFAKKVKEDLNGSFDNPSCYIFGENFCRTFPWL